MTNPLSDDFCTRYHCSQPPFPYVVGEHLMIRSHVPPAPTTGGCSLHRQSSPGEADTFREREEVHPSERCLLHPPLPGADGSTTATLEITRAIQAGDNHNAQLFMVRFKSVSPSHDALPADTELLAKIYDPLYFDHVQDDADPFLCVDHEYSHETATYMHLSELQGRLIPRYFGSFTLKWRIGDSVRYVRLILIENVPGTPTQQLDPREFSQSRRMDIMKAVIDAETQLFTHDVFNGDLHPAECAPPLGLC